MRARITKERLFSSAPSVFTLAKIWPDHAKALRAVLAQDLRTDPPLLYSYSFRYDLELSKEIEAALEECSSILDLHGVEGFVTACGRRSFLYVNEGDSYGTTLLCEEGTRRVFVSSCGDVVESLERNGYRVP